MAELKLVIGTTSGKSYQKDVKGPDADVFSKKKIGDSIKGVDCGLPGYEFLITGGSDKCGFPMRKGIQLHRKVVMIGKSVGFSGKDRNKKEQPGLLKRRTVCGERITSIIHQVNLKVVKEGPEPFAEKPAAAETKQ